MEKSGDVRIKKHHFKKPLKNPKTNNFVKTF